MFDDDRRGKLLAELGAKEDYGILLAAQMGGAPQELQFIIQTARFDEKAQGLRPRSQYILRALGVVEHRVSLGVFGNLFFADEHPILLHYNEARAAVRFQGQPEDIHELALDIHQAYLSTFGPWREITRDLNREQPLAPLLASGGGLLGAFPRSGAERMVRVFAHHGLSATLEDQEHYDLTDEHQRSRKMKLLGIDDSYIIALDFTVDEMGKV